MYFQYYLLRITGSLSDLWFTLLSFFPKASWHFSDPASRYMLEVIDLHHDIIFCCVVIVGFVLYFLADLFRYYRYNVDNISSKRSRAIFSQNVLKRTAHNDLLEIIWTIVPGLLLFSILIPSYSVLYNSNDLSGSSFRLKIIGHQWYWSYEYNSPYDELGFIEFDSFMKISKNENSRFWFRLLDADRSVLLCLNRNTDIFVTSADVIHSWCVPSFGIKIDACPGRLNRVITKPLQRGIFYGQCSEICGVNHGAMPIIVEVLNLKEYNKNILELFTQDMNLFDSILINYSTQK